MVKVNANGVPAIVNAKSGVALAKKLTFTSGDVQGAPFGDYTAIATYRPAATVGSGPNVVLKATS